jgi:hypothetical protein
VVELYCKVTSGYNPRLCAVRGLPAQGARLRAPGGQEAALVRVGLCPIVALEKQLPTLLGNLV